MQLPIRDASRFVIGAAIIRNMAAKSQPDNPVTFENVASLALREGSDGQSLRSSIEKLADQEGVWFRSTPPHTLATDRVMQTRTQEVHTLNETNLAALATIEFGADAAAGNAAAKDALQSRLQAAVEAIDKMPGSTTERRTLLDSLRVQTSEAHGDPAFMTQELRAAQKSYLDRFREERLAAYTSPSLERSDDLDFGM
jgi:hypothetical protein